MVYFLLCMDFLLIPIFFFLWLLLLKYFYYFCFIHIKVMFTYLFEVYKHFKAGLLVDFYFKKSIFLFLKLLFFYSNIIFSEKYFIEYNFLVLKKFLNYLVKIIDLFSNEFVFSFISVIILILLFIICFI